MIVYLSVMFLCCILLYATRNNKNKVSPLAIAFGLIWLMVSLQDGWGGDYDAYIKYFDWYKGQMFNDILVDESHGDIGYKVLMWLMPTPHYGLVLGFGIWCFAAAFFFYHFVPQKWWFFAILFVFFDKAILMGMVASYLRMALANAFLIFCVYFVWKKKRLRSILLLLIGSLFHKSVLFLFPMIFVGQGRNKVRLPFMLGLFVIFAVFFMIMPSAWTDLVESIIFGNDIFEGYQYYLEGQGAVKTKGASLIIIFYWVYLLSMTSNEKALDGKEYLMIYYALIRIAFALLPAVGLSTRFFYYIDLYFFAGMMCVMNRLPKNSIHKYGVAFTLLIMFWYFVFHAYSKTSFFIDRWGTYNPIF